MANTPIILPKGSNVERFEDHDTRTVTYTLVGADGTRIVIVWGPPGTECPLLITEGDIQCWLETSREEKPWLQH